MRFSITRTSSAYQEEPPCPEATTDGSKTIFAETKWTVDLATIEDLVALVQREHQIIIAPPERAIGEHPAGELYQLEIYDSYRE